MPDNTKTPQPAADPIQEPAAPASPTAADLVVDLWFVDNFYNAGPELTTELFNRFNLAKDDLKRRLNALA